MSAEIVRIFVGLDLGQSVDPSALAVVERAELVLDEIDYVTYERRRAWRWRVLFLERMRLGTPYPAVVDRVRDVVRRPALFGRCELAMDATGLGMPVLDMLRAANLGCRIALVLMTGGEREGCNNGIWHVPKRDLIYRVAADAGEAGTGPDMACLRCRECRNLFRRSQCYVTLSPCGQRRWLSEGIRLVHGVNYWRSVAYAELEGGRRLTQNRDAIRGSRDGINSWCYAGVGQINTEISCGVISGIDGRTNSCCGLPVLGLYRDVSHTA
jgi:hypothetical protein